MVRGLTTKPARIGSDKIYLTKARDFLKISLKNAAEYEDKLIKQTEAQEMLKDAQRLVEWVENRVGK
jgi:hypothetical protein